MPNDIDEPEDSDDDAFGEDGTVFSGPVDLDDLPTGFAPPRPAVAKTPGPLPVQPPPPRSGSIEVPSRPTPMPPRSGSITGPVSRPTPMPVQPSVIAPQLDDRISEPARPRRRSLLNDQRVMVAVFVALIAVIIALAWSLLRH